MQGEARLRGLYRIIYSKTVAVTFTARSIDSRGRRYCGTEHAPVLCRRAGQPVICRVSRAVGRIGDNVRCCIAASECAGAGEDPGIPCWVACLPIAPAWSGVWSRRNPSPTRWVAVCVSGVTLPLNWSKRYSTDCTTAFR